VLACPARAQPSHTDFLREMDFMLLIISALLLWIIANVVLVSAVGEVFRWGHESHDE
jgi:hypothetical protein